MKVVDHDSLDFKIRDRIKILKEANLDILTRDFSVLPSHMSLAIKQLGIETRLDELYKLIGKHYNPEIKGGKLTWLHIDV